MPNEINLTKWFLLWVAVFTLCAGISAPTEASEKRGLVSYDDYISLVMVYCKVTAPDTKKSQRICYKVMFQNFPFKLLENV